MPAYLVGTVNITDPERFGAYAKAIKNLASEFDGEPLMAGAVGVVFEGECPVGERVVVTRFPSADHASAYLSSEKYIAAKALRSGAAEVTLRLVVV